MKNNESQILFIANITETWISQGNQSTFLMIKKNVYKSSTVFIAYICSNQWAYLRFVFSYEKKWSVAY